MKLKRLLALVGSILLLSLYLISLILALIDSPFARNLFGASIVSTIVIPILLYGYILIYRITRGSADDTDTKTKDFSDDTEPPTDS